MSTSVLRIAVAILLAIPGSAGLVDASPVMQESQPPFRIHFLTGEDGVDCGVGFNPADNAREQVFGYWTREDEARVRVDGQTHRLRLENARVDRRGRTVEQWSDGAVKVRVTYWKTGEYEEGVEYEGELSVTFRGTARSIRVEGYEGC